MVRAIESSAVAPAVFVVEGSRNTGNQGRSHSSNGSNENNGRNGRGNGGRGGCKPYVPRCQIYKGEHYADKCPQFFQARASPPAPPSANLSRLAQDFNRSCNVSEATFNWYGDSGASAHMTPQQSTLDSFKPYNSNDQVIAGNSHSLNISRIGYRGLSNDIKLLDILVVPHLTKNM